jgi:CheY-like chemotaxis protein
MATKVLVFESDPAFAGELRNEFGKLGCFTTIVDDGNLGLQQAANDRPDLILLSIELPRMNGFSVCNKLKKDPSLKEVPLIIMSSDSSDETFEQHKKLRTRAEDYVHKPIAFGELLQHIQGFLPLVAAPQDFDAAIVIDDEIEIGSTDYLGDENGVDTSNDSLSDIPPPVLAARRAGTVDADMDAFAESAFGRLTEPDAPFGDVHDAPNGASQNDPPPSAVRRPNSQPAPRAPSVPPASSSQRMIQGVDPAEHSRVRGELSQATERLQQLGKAIEDMQVELETLRAEAGDAERRSREVEELRAKLATAPRAAGVSSREFLELREALNRKDKEILTLKEQISKKDKHIVEAQDRGLALERTHADMDERLLALERELDDTREKNESLAADRELAKKASDDFRARLEKTRVEGESKDRQLAEQRGRHAEELVAAEERFAAMRAELDQILANERAEHARALDQSEERRKDDLERVRRDREAELAGTRAEFDQQLVRLRGDAERHEQAALDELRAELAVSASHALGEANDRAQRLGSDLSAAREEVALLKQSRGELEGKVAVGEARIASLETEFAGARQELDATQQQLSAESARADRGQVKWQADRQSLERAKDALAVALARIEDVEERSP